MRRGIPGAEEEVAPSVTGGERVMPPMTESELLAAVLELAAFAGFRCHHVRPAWSQRGYRTPLQGDKGFPDLCLCGHKRLLIVELKSEDGEVTPEQWLWIEALTLAGIEAYIWRPDDWADGTIAKALGCEGRVVGHR